MVRFVVEAPLADDDVGAGVLDLLDHLGEFGVLVLLQFFEFRDAGDVEFVLRFWFGGFEGAG